MLKIVNRKCAGIDVHKKIIVVTIAKTNEQDITAYIKLNLLILLLKI